MDVSAEADANLVEVLLLQLTKVEQNLALDVAAATMNGGRDNDGQSRGCRGRGHDGCHVEKHQTIAITLYCWAIYALSATRGRP